ncbi:metallophosphoesterase [Fusobacterium sp. PH5-44]|uniref:metallophosphoesterase n=1 Tax=unclassified Fusobacterium TaxID=2648384 RepID=UPI003D237B58
MKSNNKKADNNKENTSSNRKIRNIFSIVFSYTKKTIIFTIFLFIFGFFVAPSMFDTDLAITHYSIITDKIIPKDIKIVVISDLHNCYYGENQSELLEAIEKENPNIIFLVGNIADEKIPIAGTIDLLEGIYKKYKVYYVPGNSEYNSKRIKEIKDTVLSYGIEYLEGNTKKYPDDNIEECVYVSGITDPLNPYEKTLLQLKKAYDQIDNIDGFKILLAHRPERIDEYLERNYDLIVSGHGNGGYWRIPYIFPNGLFAHEQGFFPKYTSNLYSHEQNGHTTKHIVSRGLSKKTLAPRIFNRPELVIININGNKSDES